MSRCLTGERRLHPSTRVVNGHVTCPDCGGWAPVLEHMNGGGRFVGEHQAPERLEVSR